MWSVGPVARITTVFADPPLNTKYLFPFPAGRDSAIDECVFMFRFGFNRQTVELGGLDVLYYGTSQTLASLPRTRFSYAGREAGAPWRQAALARIDLIRKGDLTVRVVDAAGKPVPGATVRIEQRRAAFEFGTCVQFALLVQDTPEKLVYRQKDTRALQRRQPGKRLEGRHPRRGLGRGVQSGAIPRRSALAPRKQPACPWPRPRLARLENLPQSLGRLRGTAREKKIPGLVREHVRQVSRRNRDWLGE